MFLFCPVGESRLLRGSFDVFFAADSGHVHRFLCSECYKDERFSSNGKVGWSQWENPEGAADDELCEGFNYKKLNLRRVIVSILLRDPERT